MSEYDIEPTDEVYLSDLPWTERKEQLDLESVDRVRAVAEKWGATVSALLGLFSALLLVKSRADIAALASGWEEAVGVLLGLALLLAAGSIWLAALAAQGTPKRVEWPSGAELRRWTLETARTAKSHIAWSRGLAFAAIVLLIGAVGVTWYGDTEPPKGSSVVIVPTGGRAACGALALQGHELVVRPSTGAPVPVRRAALTAVAKCP